MKRLNISKDFSLPAEAVTETFLDLGQRGAGKTNTAAVMFEEFQAIGAPCAVLTPIDVWWGLKSSADGKGPGLPIYIFGGQHADLPLTPTAGRLIADVLIEQRISCVICTQGFSGKERAAFVTDFAERLLDKNREPLHLIVEEADAFIPQKPYPGEERMLGAMDRLIRWGRSPSAIGGTFISQRSAKINKDITTQCSVLLAHRTSGPQDMDAIKEWFKYHQDPERQRQVMSEISSLPKGSVFIYSPAWLEYFGKCQIRRRHTFDSASTPKLGAKHVELQTAVVDLKLLEEKMAATLEKSKADDPKELRKQIVELKKKWEQANREVPAKIETVEVSCLTNDDRDLLREFSARMDSFCGEFEELRTEMEQVSALYRRLPESKGVKDSLTNRPHAPAVKHSGQFDQKAHLSNPGNNIAPKRQTPSQAAQSSGLGKCERAILQVLAQFPDGCESGKLTLLAGYKFSGSFSNSLGRLRTMGFIEGPNTGVMRITSAGHAAGPFESLPHGDELVQYWLNHSSFGLCERKILSELVANPKGLTSDQICEKTGYSFSGSFSNALGKLRTSGLLVGRNTEVMRASEILFE